MALAIALVSCVASTASAATPSPYSTASYAVSTFPYTFGQDPTFMPDGRVVVGEDYKQGAGNQIYLHNADGSGTKCLTCELKPPNNVPITRPQGDWILFHSWLGHNLVLGSPGYGGVGSAVFVMRPDGSQVTRLTNTDPYLSHGNGEGEDAYHAYWSPDGRHIEWAQLNGNFITDNGTNTWDVRVADFVADGKSPPHLANIRVVRPANNDWYETQWWAPDGSGFLYTETFGNAVTPQLFFCKLTASGCHVTQLTNNPSWNEQAIFTPDQRSVIFMSSRDHPGFFNTWAAAAQAAGIPTSADNLLVLPIFEAAYLQPVAEEATDLYQLDLATGSVRRLTTDGNDGWIIPEFTWDPTNSYLMWSEARIKPGVSVLEPIDLGRQLANEVSLLQNPPTPPTITPGSVNALDVGVPLERRTRILRFNLPAGPAVTAPTVTICAPARVLRFKLHHGFHARVVKVIVFVNGRHVLTQRGHALARVVLRRPAGRRFVVKIIDFQSSGGTVTSTRIYVACSKTPPNNVITHKHGRKGGQG